MSKLFYDHLVKFEQIEIELKKYELEGSDKEEMERLIDEQVHYRVMTCVLTHLPRHHHTEFLEKFAEKPYDEKLLLFLKEKVEDIEEKIIEEIKDIEALLLEDLGGKHGN